jgi:hypothetical protein
MLGAVMELVNASWLDFLQISLALVLLYVCSAVLLGPQLWPGRPKRKQAQAVQHHQDRAPLMADNT